MFRFDGDGVQPSLEQVIFPRTLAGKKVNIKTDIAESDTALL